jgi:Gamma-glutamyltranspeptidase
VNTVQDPPVVDGAARNVRPGIMTTTDLSGYRSIERTPTVSSYRGLQVYGMGPLTSGGSTVGEALNILEGYAKSDLPRDDAAHGELELVGPEAPGSAAPVARSLRKDFRRAGPCSEREYSLLFRSKRTASSRSLNGYLR